MVMVMKFDEVQICDDVRRDLKVCDQIKWGMEWRGGGGRWDGGAVTGPVQVKYNLNGIQILEQNFK